MTVARPPNEGGSSRPAVIFEEEHVVDATQVSLTLHNDRLNREEHMTPRRHGARSIIAGLGAVLIIFATGVGTANASAGSTNLRTFATQATSAGLAPDQARTLQARVDGYLVRFGGTQVSANKIQYVDGATLLLSLPGERQAREMTATAAAGCEGRHMCAWQHTDYSGDKIDLFFCNDVHPVPWVGQGIWFNNQDRGTTARFLDNNHNEIANTGPAPSQGLMNWTPTFYIDPC
jgi:hypothetical protein